MSDMKSDHENIIESKLTMHEATARETKRYWLGDGEQVAIEGEDGPWVLYTDHVTALSAATAEQDKAPVKQLTVEELTVLMKWLEKEYLPYDNYILHDVVKKIQRIIENPRQTDVMVE